MIFFIFHKAYILYHKTKLCFLDCFSTNFMQHSGKQITIGNLSLPKWTDGSTYKSALVHVINYGVEKASQIRASLNQISFLYSFTKTEVEVILKFYIIINIHCFVSLNCCLQPH